MSRVDGPRRIADSAFALSANGFADGPAEALRDHLVARGATVTVVAHPLTRDQGRRHLIKTYDGASELRARSIWTPLRPPASFAVDPLVPLVLPRVDAWFGFNPLACARGLAQRGLGRARRVVLWSVDFTPDRFGSGTALTRVYDRLDRFCCRRADARVELSVAARDARARRLNLGEEGVPVHVVPMGAWLGRVPHVGSEGFARRRVVFLGHLTERQGVDVLLEAMALLRGRDAGVVLDVIGGGEELARLQARAAALGLDASVRFHGFVQDLRDVESLLADASIAVAPYVPGETAFTRYADPGKLKNYLAAGLPIVMTDVPPNARELAAEGGAELAAYDAAAIAAAVEDGLASPERWNERRERALRFARQFDWPVLLDGVLERLGFRTG